MINEIVEGTYPSIATAIKAVFGHDAMMVRQNRLSGGDINDAYRINVSTGDKVFVKTNLIKNMEFFLTESNGLRALRATKKIGVPNILGTGIDEKSGCSFLLLEYIESAPRIKTYWETFGHQLAELHRVESSRWIKSEKDNVSYGF